MPLNKKNILLIANGERPGKALVERVRRKADFIIAVDGGLAHCHHYNISPDRLIGDLDSYNPEHARVLKTENIIRVPDQNQTDLQKALAYVQDLDPAGVMIIGALGGRADHSLANLIIVNNHEEEWPLWIYDNRGCFTLLGEGRHTLEDPPGTTVSLFTLSGAAGVHTQGFKYPVRTESLDASFIGVSNVIREKPAHISIGSGKILLYRQWD